MKRYLFPIVTSLIIGCMLSYFIISQYDDMDSLAVSSNAETLYYIQRGAYSDKANMENNMKDFEYYIYNVEDNLYHAYIGISQSKDNALKIQNYYKNLGFETEIKEKVTDNTDFINILKQYDELLSATSSDESIKTICNQVLSRYEELVNAKN
mgnify:CR=1 FL=1